MCEFEIWVCNLGSLGGFPTRRKKKKKIYFYEPNTHNVTHPSCSFNPLFNSMHDVTPTLLLLPS